MGAFGYEMGPVSAAGLKTVDCWRITHRPEFETRGVAMSRRTLLAGLGLLVAIMASPITATANDNALDHIIKAGMVRVAVPDNFPPFGDLGPDGNLQGYDIDTAALIAAALGVKLELVPVSSTDRIPYLTDAKVDMVISSLGKDAAREKAIDFSIAYAPSSAASSGPRNACRVAYGVRGAVRAAQADRGPPKTVIRQPVRCPLLGHSAFALGMALLFHLQGACSEPVYGTTAQHRWATVKEI